MNRFGLVAWVLLGFLTAAAVIWVLNREPAVSPAWASDPGPSIGGGCKGC